MQSQIVTASDNTTSLRSQIETLKKNENPSSQIVMMDFSKNRTGKYLPYAFTELGIAMLSGVLNSDKAINMNIAIMRAFVAIRKIVLQQQDTKEQLREIKERLSEHDVQLSQIYDAMENILDEKASQRNGIKELELGLNPTNSYTKYASNTYSKLRFTRCFTSLNGTVVPSSFCNDVTCLLAIPQGTILLK